MSELWETLTTGLILSLLFIGVSYLFLEALRSTHAADD